ncbi:MAG TPA: DNA polymerase III subunit beta [Acidimicrobiales bacterium]
MKFRCERDVLADALATAGRAATGRTGSLPVLSGVRIDLHGDELRVTGTDLELTIQVAVTVSGDSDGATVLPARLAADIVRSLETGAVTVEADQDDARISAGRSQFAVRPLSLDDFPRLPDAAADAVTLPSATFGEALRQVARAASGDESRPILTGVLLAAENDGLRLVATDSYRLAVRDLPGTSVLRTDQKVLVPSRALNELARLLPSSGEVTLRLGERDATFEIGGARLSTRLIEGEFPNYRQLIPQQYPNRLTVGREPLLDAVRRVKLLARDSTPIRLSMSPDALDLTATTQDIGQAAESLDAKYEGAEMVVAFNPDYLSAGVDAVTTDEVVLETLDAMKPAVLRAGEATDFLYLLMPVRVP